MATPMLMQALPMESLSQGVRVALGLGGRKVASLDGAQEDC